MAVDRRSLIDKIYYNYLGQVTADDAGAEYWAGLAEENGWDEQTLQDKIVGSAKSTGAIGSNPNVKQDVMADQTYAAFLRNMQFDESQVQSNLEAAKEAAGRRITGQKGAYDTQRTQVTNNIDSSYEARQNRSGKRITDLSEGRAQVDKQQLDFETGINEGRATMERQSAQDIARMRREDAEQQVQARDRLTLRSANL